MDSYRDQAELKPAGGALVIDGVDTTEDDLHDMITSLEARLGDVRELQQEREDIEGELADLRDELESREAEIDEREQILSESSTELSVERHRLRDERDALLTQQRELEAKRAAIEAREHQQQDQVTAVNEMQARLDAAESALRAERERRSAEAETFRREQEELATRERELAAHAAEKGADSPEITELASQLADAQKLANERAAQAEQRAAEAEQRTLQFEARCRELSEQCNVVRKELKGSRAEVRRVEAELPQRIVQRQIADNRAEQARRTVAVACTWSAAAVCAASASIAALNADPIQTGMMLGLCFAALFFGAHAVAGRLFDAPAIAIGAIGAGFGWWFPMWQAAVVQALETWALPTGTLPASVVAELPMGVSVATALLAITVGVFALTWSGKLLVQIGAVSLFAGALAVLPDESGFALGAAAVIWLTVAGAGLTRWANSQMQAKAAPVRVNRPNPQAFAGGRAI